MLLGVKPHVFLTRVLIVFVLTYLIWSPVAPHYTRLLAFLTEKFLHLTEISSDPHLHRVSKMWVEGTAIFFAHRLFPSVRAPGIPAEWVQANIVLLIPLMLATPAATYRQRFGRLGLAIFLALLLQVLDLAVTVKSFFASELGAYSDLYYSDSARWWYQFGDAFAQSMDTQLFPFVIWAGIHFRQLLPARAPAAGDRQQRRRAERAKRQAARESR